MIRFKAALAALGLLLAMTLPVFSTQPATAVAVPDTALHVLCIWRPVQGAAWTTSNTRVSGKIWQQYCWVDGDGNPHNGWVNLTRALLVANHRGTHEACGWTDNFNGVSFHLYFYQPYDGRNWDVKAHLGCEPDTITTRFVDLHPAPRFIYKGGVRPQWRINATVNLDFGVADVHSSRHGTFPHP